jgi:hypothetical protein
MPNKPDKKKLIGIYLPISLISRIKEFASWLYLEKGIEKSQSEIAQEALEEYFKKNKPK